MGVCKFQQVFEVKRNCQPVHVLERKFQVDNNSGAFNVDKLFHLLKQITSVNDTNLRFLSLFFLFYSEHFDLGDSIPSAPGFLAV